MIAFNDFVPRLKGRRMNGDDEGVSFCPAHDDREHPSLSFKRKADGGVLVKCFVGCDWKKITAALGFSANGHGGPSANGARPRLTLDDFAAAKGLPAEFLRECGV